MAPVTKTGDNAKLSIMLTGQSLHTAGFDTEGIVNTNIAETQDVSPLVIFLPLISCVPCFKDLFSKYFPFIPLILA